LSKLFEHQLKVNLQVWQKWRNFSQVNFHTE